jgi:hypothetical protein
LVLRLATRCSPFRVAIRQPPSALSAQAWGQAAWLADAQLLRHEVRGQGDAIGKGPGSKGPV